jgi:hypothetical protein
VGIIPPIRFIFFPSMLSSNTVLQFTDSSSPQCFRSHSLSELTLPVTLSNGRALQLLRVDSRTSTTGRCRPKSPGLEASPPPGCSSPPLLDYKMVTNIISILCTHLKILLSLPKSHRVEDQPLSPPFTTTRSPPCPRMVGSPISIIICARCVSAQQRHSASSPSLADGSSTLHSAQRK